MLQHGVRYYVGTTDNIPWATGWGNLGSTWEHVSFWKTPEGVVHLQGLASKLGGTPTSPDLMFVLPPGFRPFEGLIFVVLSRDVVGRVDVKNDGTVLWRSGGTTEVDYTSLSGITFMSDERK